MIIPVILAGGSGTRLWPFSRELYPKQLLPLVGCRSMIQNTVLRLSGVEGTGNPIVICNQNHRFLVAEQLREIDVKPEAIIIEPAGRNTAPAVAVAALKALSMDENPVLLILPADHHIEDIEAFRGAVGAGARFSRQGYLITFGIVPTAPETGYGYIQKGEAIPSETDACQAFRIARFVEKPDRDTAQRYLDCKEYCWNSGMFMFGASRILEELGRFTPAIGEACRRAFEKGVSDLDFYRLDEDAFRSCPSDSIDYAVMEKTETGAMIPLSAGWNDLGSWDALWEIGNKDEHRNVVIGDVLTHGTSNCYLHASSRLVAAVGIENYTVVETSDAVLVAPRGRLQEVKALVGKLNAGKRTEAICHRTVYRPWGSSESIVQGGRFHVKRTTVKPGGKLSLQKHFHRAEHWVVVHGTALVTRGEEEFLLREDESTYIPLGVSHRIQNPGKIPLEIIEVQSGAYLSEDDIVRLDDVYER